MLDSSLYIENYYALMACILNDKLCSDNAIRKIIEPGVKKSFKKNRALEVTFLDTGEVKVYKNSRAVADYTGIDVSSVCSYACKQSVYKNMYKFRYLD